MPLPFPNDVVDFFHRLSQGAAVSKPPWAISNRPSLTSNQLIRRDGQIPNAPSRGVINGIRDRGGDTGDTDFSHSARADRIESEIGFAHERDIDLRNIGIRRDMVVGEI